MRKEVQPESRQNMEIDNPKPLAAPLSQPMDTDYAFVRARYPKAFYYRTTRKHYAVMDEPMGRCLGEGRRVAGAWANARATIEAEVAAPLPEPASEPTDVKGSAALLIAEKMWPSSTIQQKLAVDMWKDHDSSTFAGAAIEVIARLIELRGMDIDAEVAAIRRAQIAEDKLASPSPVPLGESIDDDRITGIYCRFCSVEIHKETRNWIHKNGSLTCANGQHAADPPKKPLVPLGEPAHVCMYDSDVLPMQYGENLPPDVEQYNSLFCKCGRVNHYGTWIPALATKAVPIEAQWWLTTLDMHGNPTLLDGAHSDAEGCNHAAYLIQAMRLPSSGKKFAVARVELFECVPSAQGANHEAIEAAEAELSRLRSQEGTR